MNKLIVGVLLLVCLGTQGCLSLCLFNCGPTSCPDKK